MKKIILSACFSFIILLSFSQDVIYKRDNTRIEAKVLEVNQTEIRYKMFANPDGPLYVIYKSEVVKIQYPNGQVDVYNPEIKKEETISPGAKEQEKMSLNFMDESLRRNIVSLNLLQFMLGYVSASYEWLDRSGNFGIKIPIGYNFASSYAINLATLSENKSSYFGGLALNIYPKHKKRVSYFVGPYLEAGQFSYIVSQYSYSGYGYYTPRTYNDGFYYACYINNGCEVLISKSFSFSFCGGPGIIRNIAPHYNSYSGYYYSRVPELNVSLNAELNLSYRF
jgi:hypothetical protein